MAGNALARRPGILGTDALAWAAFKAGRIDEAQAYAKEALRLGTLDPRLNYHAGAIALAADDVETAERYLLRALDGDAALPPEYARDARIALAQATAASTR